MKSIHLGRKWWAFIISLIAIVVCAVFGFDVSVGVGTLFGIYCAGNCTAKIATKNKIMENKEDE